MIDRLDREKDSRPAGIRGFLYWWLESEENDRRYLVDLFIAGIIILSIVIIILDISYGPIERTPSWVTQTNFFCLLIFVVEYLCRFWINTDFLMDWKEKNLWTAVKNKLLWMVKPFSIIDLVAIIPVGALRSLRIFRFFRIARLLRVVKLGRYSAGFSGFVEELKNRSYEFIALTGVVCAVILIGATAIFTVESPHMEGSLIQNFGDALWWATVTTTTVGYGDIYPKYLEGRLIATALMLTSIGIVGALGGILTSAMMERIRKMREGQIERITFKNHIVFCGWTDCAKKVAEMLYKMDLLDRKRLVVINEKEVPEVDYIMALEGDFSKPASLKTVNTGDADVVVVFYQMDDHLDYKQVTRRSVLTTLQAEKLNPEEEAPYTITEVFDRESASIITGQDIQGDETLDKEGFDANLILNTIQYPGHTTKMFYNLSNFTDQWIQLKEPTIYFSKDELPVDAGRFKQMLIEDQYNVTFLGVLEQREKKPLLNPPDDYELTDSTSLYVVEESPYSSEEEIEDRGVQEYHYEIKKEPLYELEKDFVFLGFNRCAEKVLESLERSRWGENDQKVVIISETDPPDKPWVEHIANDYSETDVIREKEWWRDKKLAIIFHELDHRRNEQPHSIDIKNAVTSLVLPRNVRVIAEIIDEDYSKVLQKDIERDIELIYKERFDANLIANSIINPGEISDLFRELGKLTGNRLKTFILSHFFPQKEEVTVMELQKKLMEEERMIFLGMLKKGAYKPLLNPKHDQKIEQGDILYFITREGEEHSRR